MVCAGHFSLLDGASNAVVVMAPKTSPILTFNAHKVSFSSCKTIRSISAVVVCAGSLANDKRFDSTERRPFAVSGFKPESRLESRISAASADVPLEAISGGSGNDDGVNHGGNGGSGGSGDDASSGGSGGDEYGPLLAFPEAMKLLSEHGITLPEDILRSLQQEGIPELILKRFIDLQKASWPLNALANASSGLRDRLLADPSFLFKVLAEVVIDCGCATFAEVQKRGDEFWKEFDLYASDMAVGIVMDIALVSMLAPAVRFGGGAAATAVGGGLQSKLARYLDALPSSMFEGALPGRRFSVGQRASTWFVKGAQYGVVGFGCGFIGQGFANSLITLKRHLRKGDAEEDEVKIPPLLQTAALWGVFMALSSNTRYQVINGLERVVETSWVSRRVPLLSSAFTIGIRFGNNVYGGMQFVDWARLAGVQ